VLNKAVDQEVPMSIEIMDETGKVIHSEYSNQPKTECDAYLRPQLKRSVGAHRYQWNMKIGRYDCIKELVATSRNLSAYDATPGNYKVKLKIGSFEQMQDFVISIDPRLLNSIPNVAEAYKERYQISESVFKGATEMSKGVRDLRQVKEQLEFILKVAKDDKVITQGNALNSKIDEWISRILQKELRTQQHNYQFEARLLIKFKDFIGSIDEGNLPVTQGTRDVAKDYLAIWNGHNNDLQSIKNKDVKDYNVLLKQAGLPEIYLP
jgi:hypothetical protein